MQDPLKNTREDMWRLVLDQSVTALVMLSECECEADVENDEDDGDGEQASETTCLLCPQYWPDTLEEEMVFEHIKVTLTKIDTLPMFIKRTFNVVNTKVSLAFLNS
jgi:hypothetical protein